MTRHFQVELTFTFINGEQSKNPGNPPCIPHFAFKVHIFWESHENLTKSPNLFKTMIYHYQVESSFTSKTGEQSKNRENPTCLFTYKVLFESDYLFIFRLNQLSLL